MTLPTSYPIGYDGTTDDFLHTKVDRSGAVRLYTASTAVTHLAVTGTVLGLQPFNAGYKLALGSRLYVTDIDTASAVTLNWGYVYSDSTTYTSNPDAFTAASTSGQAGGIIEVTSSEGFQWTAQADGWIAVTTAAALPVTGTIYSSLAFCYDKSGVTNNSGN